MTVKVERKSKMPMLWKWKQKWWMHRGDTFPPIRSSSVQLLHLQLLLIRIRIRIRRRRKKLHRSVQWTILTRSNWDHYSHAANNSCFFHWKSQSWKLRRCAFVQIQFYVSFARKPWAGKILTFIQRRETAVGSEIPANTSNGTFIYIGRGKTIQRSFLTIQERDHCIKYSFNFVCIFESSFIPKATIMIYQHRKRFLSIHPNPLI